MSTSSVQLADSFVVTFIQSFLRVRGKQLKDTFLADLYCNDLATSLDEKFTSLSFRISIFVLGQPYFPRESFQPFIVFVRLKFRWIDIGKISESFFTLKSLINFTHWPKMCITVFIYHQYCIPSYCTRHKCYQFWLIERFHRTHWKGTIITLVFLINSQVLQSANWLH